MWDYCDTAVCFLPHHSHYLRNAVKIWTRRMMMKTSDDAAAAVVATRVLM
jgi:hypothetical protein